MMGKKKRQILPEQDFTIIVHKDSGAPKRKIPISAAVAQQRRHAPILPPGPKYETNKIHTSHRRVQEDSWRTANDKAFEVGEPGPSSSAIGQKVAVEVDLEQPVKKRNRLFEPLAQLRFGGGDSRRLKSCSKCNESKKLDVAEPCAHDIKKAPERNTAISVPPTVATIRIKEKPEPSSSFYSNLKPKSREEIFLERQKRFAVGPVTVIHEKKDTNLDSSIKLPPIQISDSGVKSVCTTSASISSLPVASKQKELQKSLQPTEPIHLPKKTEERQDSIVPTKKTQVEVGASLKTKVVGRQNEGVERKISNTSTIKSGAKPESPVTTVELKSEADMRLGKRLTFPGRNGRDVSPNSKKKRLSPIRPPSPSLPPHLQCPPMKHMLEVTPSTSVAEFIEVKKPPLPEETEIVRKDIHVISNENSRTIMNTRKSPTNSIAMRLTIPGLITKTIEEEEPMPKINFINPKVLRTKEGKRILPFFTNKYIFSNHFPCPGLMVNGRKFCCTEQYYMWRKAKFGRNEAAAGAILMSSDPKQMKLIGSSIENFDEVGWKRVSWKYMAEANFAKYKQFDELRYQLMRTAGSILVEASPTDKWWGAGLDIDSPLLKEPRRWPGKNVMGNLLMEIREALAEKQEYQYEVTRAKRSLIEEH